MDAGYLIAHVQGFFPGEVNREECTWRVHQRGGEAFVNLRIVKAAHKGNFKVVDFCSLFLPLTPSVSSLNDVGCTLQPSGYDHPPPLPDAVVSLKLKLSSPRFCFHSVDTVQS